MAFKYSRYKPIYLNDTGFPVTEWPICADSVLYRYAASNVPQQTEVTLWQGKTAGYTGDQGLRELANDVLNSPANTQEITNINFNPFTFAGNDLNSKARFVTHHGVKFLQPYSDSGNDPSDNVAELVCRAFNCELEESTGDLGYLFDKTPGNQYVVGYNYWNNNGANCRASNSMFGAYQCHGGNTLWSHGMWRRDDTVGGVNRKILECSIRLFPEEIFAGETKSKDGCTLDPDGSIAPVPDGTASQRLDVRLNIHIYYDELAKNWNWNAGLYATEWSTGDWDVIMLYQDKRTGTVHNPNDPDDQDEEPMGAPVPGAPSTDIVTLGALNAYIISPSDLHTLFDYLNSVDILDSLVKMWTNPIQGIVSLHLLPFACTYSTLSTQVYFHGLPIGLPAANPVTFLTGGVPKTWQTWDMGGVYIPYDTKTYTDMAPFTKVSIYIPMVGMHHLDTDEVMGKTVRLNYTIDVVSGAVTAFVSVNGCIRYTYTGNCAASIPVSQQDWGNMYMSMARIAAAGVTTGITSGMETGSPMRGLGAGLGQIGGNIGNISKPTVSRSGSISGTSAVMASRIPYILVDRPVKAYNKDGMKGTEGLPSSSYVPMSSLSGYQEIKECHLDGIGATDSEKKEIESLLKSGVFF